MKKIIVAIIITTLIVIAGCSYEKSDLYDSMISDVANDGILAIEPECDFWTNEYFVKENMGKKTCDFSAKKYTGEYDKSIVYKTNTFTTDLYVDSNFIEFGLKSDTSELVFVNLMNAEFFSTEPFLDDVEKPEENAMSLAKEIAQKYVADISEYEQIVEEPITREKEKDGKIYTITYYGITYARKINDFYSSDYISLKITSKGHLASLLIGDIGKFSGVKIDVDKSLLNDSIAKKIESTYGGTPYSVLNYEIRDQKITYSPEGGIYVLSDIGVSLQDSTNYITKTAIEIITKVG